MTPRLAAVTSILLCTSCAHLPPLSGMSEQDRSAAAASCRQAFPQQPWRATHTIVATLPFGHNGGLVGVIAAGPEGLHAVLLTPEGITLFDGVQKSGGSGGLTLQRAVPPFDRSDFAAALMADVGNAFLPPAGEPSDVGRRRTGETVCRWSLPSHEATEIDLGAGGPLRIRTYRNLNVTRQIELLGVPDKGFYPQVRLAVPGGGGYTLDMSLVDHE
jgi:hypothetical protein